ncbi:UNVERIFIED_CONTAM: hypothetical protein Sangu_2030400 [Sesamum angustifolium]|uniref:Uncharacterized protein n=1 Tax=Sesamum angustifolium TaxID=2727405 RepID=A0AAW2LJ98_9LAMI
MKQPSKLPLKGFVPSTQEEEGGYEAMIIDKNGFDPKAFKLLIKVGYNPKENLKLGKLSPEATNKKLHGLDVTQVMLKKNKHAIQDSRVGLDFTLPKPIHIAIKRPSNNYVVEGCSSTKDDMKKEKQRDSVFNRLGPHEIMIHGTTNKQSVFNRLGPHKKAVYQKKCMFKVAASSKDIKSSHTQKLRILIPSRMRR